MATEGGALEDEDYMGDLSSFLPPDSPPSKKKHHAPKHAQQTQISRKKLPKTLGWQERRQLERQRKQEEEDAITKAGLEASIPPSNVGFKMLQKMGFSPSFGGSEPVGLEIRRSRAGIGASDPRVERKRKESELESMKKIMEQEIQQEFGSRRRAQWRSRKVMGDFRKVEAALMQLENREVAEPEKKDDEDGEGKNEEEEEKQITEEDLRNILMKLRDEHHYCLYCGCKYESFDSLMQNCPGLDEDDH